MSTTARTVGGTPLVLLLALPVVASACATHAIDVPPVLSTTSASLTMHTAENPGASFEVYRTFSFGPLEGTSRSQEVERRLSPLITRALVEKGYGPAATGKGDLVVVSGSGARDVPSRDSPGWLPDDENEDFVEGSIVVDVFDGARGHRVWHGASQASVNPDAIDQQRLEQAVRDLLASFPKAGSRTEAPTP